ncbi:MAG TPA: DUF1080 domain-containing protein [Opitutaceae bacterium]|jgi:hypothetical protein
MKNQRLLLSLLFAAAALLATSQGLADPAGTTADVHEDIGAGHGAGAKRWPAPQPIFAPDLSNAIFKPGSWAWEDGILVGKGGSDIWTKELYGDFVVNLDFRCQKNTNSGVFLRCSDIPNWLNTAIEIQILQSENTDKHITGAMYDCQAPSRHVEIVPGTWYHFTIMAVGSRITVVLDGEKLVDVDLNKWTQAHKNPDGTPNKFTTAYKDMARVGRLGLQYHTARIEFRNLLVDRL